MRPVGQSEQPISPPHSTLLVAPRWRDYELIDSGNGLKFERFGAYTLVRPESQAIWLPALPQAEWDQADATFQKGKSDEGAGSWLQRRAFPERWLMQHDSVRFWARLTPFKHTGVFPEHSAHWEWVRHQLALLPHARVLVLFGYTGLYSLLAAHAGATVVHVDASKPAVRWAQDNQAVAGLQAQPIRWIVDDVAKFLAREYRRNSRYDLIIMDPPVFGRGPKGEIWRLNEGLQTLVEQCTALLSDRPLGMLVNAYATSISPLAVLNVVQTVTRPFGGTVQAGELVLMERATARPLPAAMYARWTAVL
jgi:23S rRNA (cytosine1962-C5)-methyltransferase